MNSRRIWFAVLMAAVYISTGFFREFVFVNINEQMRVTYYQTNDSQVAPSMQFLNSFEYGTLYYAKWPLTFLFTVIFAAFAALIVRAIFQNRRLVIITLLAYSAVFFTGLLFYGIGVLAGSVERFYVIARFLAGMVETPALLIVLVPAFYLFRQENKAS
ncbi:MAG: hypothetical protein FD123_3524 [Bacteroidetes bacterium]|nr:MAG: hypothetical protein FD123_3524 [Bacteroidota bacterium]